MQHTDNAGGVEQMEVDHFDPRKKKDFWQQYKNLYLAKRACNLKKWENWPTRQEQALGIRFLDPCSETDYGVHIFEDPITHKVWGATPAGKYQVRMMGLNAQNLIDERKDRAKLIERLTSLPVRLIKDPDDAFQQTLVGLRRQIDIAIPIITVRPEPPPP